MCPKVVRLNCLDRKDESGAGIWKLHGRRTFLQVKTQRWHRSRGVCGQGKTTGPELSLVSWVEGQDAEHLRARLGLQGVPMAIPMRHL